MFLTYSQLKILNSFPQKWRNTFLILTKIHKGSPYARNLCFSHWNSLPCHLQCHAIGRGLSCHSWDIFFPCCLPCLLWADIPHREQHTNPFPNCCLPQSCTSRQITLTFGSLVFQAKGCCLSGADLWPIELAGTGSSSAEGHNWFIPFNSMHCQGHVSPESELTWSSALKMNCAQCHVTVIVSSCSYLHWLLNHAFSSQASWVAHSPEQFSWGTVDKQWWVSLGSLSPSVTTAKSSIYKPG